MELLPNGHFSAFGRRRKHFSFCFAKHHHIPECAFDSLECTFCPSKSFPKQGLVFLVLVFIFIFAVVCFAPSICQRLNHKYCIRTCRHGIITFVWLFLFNMSILFALWFVCNIIDSMFIWKLPNTVHFRCTILPWGYMYCPIYTYHGILCVISSSLLCCVFMCFWLSLCY